MPQVVQVILLFTLNLFDAVLTVYWVRHGHATEGNHLMATLLEAGEAPFLAVKLAIGAVTALVLWRWRDYRLAQFGLALSLALYACVMVIHLVTGLSAFDVVRFLD